jgi:hypothetical protein
VKIKYSFVRQRLCKVLFRVPSFSLCAKFFFKLVSLICNSIAIHVTKCTKVRSLPGFIFQVRSWHGGFCFVHIMLH